MEGPLRDGQSGVYCKSPKQQAVVGDLRSIITYLQLEPGSNLQGLRMDRMEIGRQVRLSFFGRARS